MISRLLQKIPIVKLVMLDKLYKSRNISGTIKYYETRKFGSKYQLLADLIYASALGDLKNYSDALRVFKSNKNEIEKSNDFSDDSKNYLINYMYKKSQKFQKIKEINEDENYLYLKKENIPKYIYSMFFHGKHY